MPLHWTIDSQNQMVTLIAEGSVTFSDLEKYLAAVEGAGALSYRKFIDATAGTFEIAVPELMAVGARIREAHKVAVGPVAILLSERQSESAARLFGFMAVAKRPMRIFKKKSAARQWIATQRPESS